MFFKSIFLSPVQLHDGRFDFLLGMERVRDLLQKKWYTEGYRLQIVANVQEQSTGRTATAVEDSTFFATSPYHIEYINTPRYFKPGLPFSIKVIKNCVQFSLGIFIFFLMSRQNSRLSYLNKRRMTHINSHQKTFYVIDLSFQNVNKSQFFNQSAQCYISLVEKGSEGEGLGREVRELNKFLSLKIGGFRGKA